MDVQTIATISIIATAVLAGLLYIVRAEQNRARKTQDDEIARVAAGLARHEAECQERNKNADERHEDVTKRLESIYVKLDRQDDKLDRLIERLL